MPNPEDTLRAEERATNFAVRLLQVGDYEDREAASDWLADHPWPATGNPPERSGGLNEVESEDTLRGALAALVEAVGWWRVNGCTRHSTNERAVDEALDRARAALAEAGGEGRCGDGLSEGGDGRSRSTARLLKSEASEKHRSTGRSSLAESAPSTCPTCGSDDPARRGWHRPDADEEYPIWRDCEDPWHTPSTGQETEDKPAIAGDREPGGDLSGGGGD